MKLTKLSLIAALALGGLLASGFTATAQDTNTAPKQGKRGPSVEQQISQMKDQLSLTDAQTPKVKAVLEDSMKKRQELRDPSVSQEDRRAKMQTLMEDQNKKLKEILTPEQFDKYQKMRPAYGKKGPGGEKKAPKADAQQ